MVQIDAGVGRALGGKVVADVRVDIDDVGKAALYLLSPLSSGVTGEIHYVDAGFNVVGMKLMDEETVQPAASA